MIVPVLSHFDFVAGQGGGHPFMKPFHKIPIIFKRVLLDKHMTYIWQSGNLAIKQIEV